MKLCFTRIRSFKVPYILSAFRIKYGRFALCLYGGNGDIVSAVFQHDYSSDVLAMMREFIQWGDIGTLVPLIDKLMELDHWIPPLLKEWLRLAQIPNGAGQIDLTPHERKIKRPAPQPKPPTLDDMLGV